MDLTQVVYFPSLIVSRRHDSGHSDSISLTSVNPSRPGRLRIWGSSVPPDELNVFAIMYRVIPGGVFFYVKGFRLYLEETGNTWRTNRCVFDMQQMS